MPPVPTLIGRDAELDALRASRGPWTCVWGMPGVGVRALVADALRDEANVVVLERADRLDAAELLARLEELRRAGTRVVMTSRRRLRVPGVAHVFVPPLSSEAAGALFGALVAERGAALGWNDVAPTTRRNLTAALGEVPGRLVDLAERAAILSPAEVLAAMETHPLGRVDVGEVLAALGAAAKRALDVLAACPYGLTLTALADATDAPTEGVEDALLELTDHALLTFEPRRDGTHYALVPPVRRFVEASWTPEHAAAVSARAAASVARRLVSGYASPPERSNVAPLLEARYALPTRERRAFVEETERLARLGLPLHVVRRALDAALERAESYGDPVERGRLLVTRADGHLMAGALGDALGDLSEAQKLARVVDDAWLDARALCVFARARHWESRLDDGLQALSEREAGDVRSPEDVQLCAAILTYGLGEVREALALLEGARERAKRRGSPNEGLIEGLMGMLLRDLGEVEHARAHFRDGLAIAERSGDTYLTAVLRNWLGLAYIDDGELALAAQELEDARATLEAFGEEQIYRAVLGHLGIVAHLERRLEDAEALFARAVALADKAHDLYRRCHFLAHLAAVRARLDRRTEAMLDLAAVESAIARSECVNPNLPALLSVLRTVVEGTTVATPTRGAHSSDVRIAVRAATEETSPRRHVLRVGADGKWFALDEGAVVSLVRRKPLARLVDALASRVDAGEATGLDSDELLAAGWPSEQITRSSGMHRVHVAVSELRKLGLAVLVSDARGYRLDAEVRRVDAAPERVPTRSDAP